MKIIKGKIKRPIKVVIYGPEGIGKTTLVSKMPGVLIIDTEGGTAHMDIDRVLVSDWSDLNSTIDEIIKDRLCQTIAIDTADWAEQASTDYICARYKKSGLEDFGYGKGYTYLGEEFRKLLLKLDEAIDAGINVAITAHAKMRKFEQPDESGSYDRWEMKLSKQVGPLLKEWCDVLLFATYETNVIKDENGKAKARGGDRIMHTQHHPCWDAKNRFGLPEKVPMDFTYISSIFPKMKPPVEELREKLGDIPEEDFIKVVASRGRAKDAATLDVLSADDMHYCNLYFDRLIAMISESEK